MKAELTNEIDFYNCCTDKIGSNINFSYIESLMRADHISIKEKTDILKICIKYEDTLHKPNDKLTFTKQVKHKIRTPDKIHVYTKSY